VTNSNDPGWGIPDTIRGVAVIGLAVAGAFLLWSHKVPTNALVLTAAGAGWVVAAWLLWTDRRRRRHEATQRAGDGDCERALHRAIDGPAWRHVGRVQRDAVLGYLADAYADERLTIADHDERADAVTGARTYADLRATLKGLL
jgi:hypothetical protein